MGEISYSVYVWSFFVLDAIADRFKPGAFSAEAVATSLVKIAVAVCLTTVLAYGSYRMIEMPSGRWRRKVVSGKGWGAEMKAENLTGGRPTQRQVTPGRHRESARSGTS